jgi:hypothetical protein
LIDLIGVHAAMLREPRFYSRPDRYNPRIMNPFKTLIRRAEREWTRTRHRLAAFPEIAAKLLREFEYDLTQDQLDRWLARWFREAGALPEQVSLHNTFGQPPITLFNNGSLVVDLYLWVAADTTIHSHGFRGAFRVLHGNSLQETYAVNVTRRIAPGVVQCDPGIPQMEILQVGDVRVILPAEKLTHRVIHLESPTVTLCVKTINEPGIHQWEYYAHGLALQRLDLDADLIKEMYYFEYLLNRNAALAARYLQQIVGTLSVVMRLTLYDALCGGALDLSEGAVDRCLEQIRKHHRKTDWFKRHMSPAPVHLKELQFAGCETALQRLVAHFINGGHDLKTIAPHLSRVAGRDLQRSDIEKVLLSLLDCELIFGFPLSPEIRATIKDAVLQPKGKIPDHLETFGQIRRMRKFLRMFA